MGIKRHFLTAAIAAALTSANSYFGFNGSSNVEVKEPLQVSSRGGKPAKLRKGTKPRTGRGVGHRRVYLCGKPFARRVKISV